MNRRHFLGALIAAPFVAALAPLLRPDSGWLLITPRPGEITSNYGVLETTSVEVFDSARVTFHDHPIIWGEIDNA